MNNYYQSFADIGSREFLQRFCVLPTEVYYL